MTFEEFELLPVSGKQELISGKLLELPPVRKRHNKAGQRIFISLLDAIERDRAGTVNPALGTVHHEMGFRISRVPDSWLIPAVSVTHFGQPGDDYFEGSPFLAVEVVSPSDLAEDLDQKIELYFANGAREVWVFYPKTVSVWVYRERTGTRFKGTLQSDLFPGLSINLDEIFAG